MNEYKRLKGLVIVIDMIKKYERKLNESRTI